MLIIVVLFISKSEAIIFLKISILENRRYVQKDVALNFSLFKAAFFTLFVWYV